MVMLQHKLNVKLSQRQILTPGLVQMVSVLALNKIELKDMINAEMVENPVLEELEDSVPLIDEVGRREEERDRAASATTAEEAPLPTEEKKDPFDEIDFGSFFQDYLDPGYRSPGEMEDIERPSFENFLSKPSTLTDHLMWQLGALSLSSGVREAAGRRRRPAEPEEGGGGARDRRGRGCGGSLGGRSFGGPFRRLGHLGKQPRGPGRCFCGHRGGAGPGRR